MSTTVLLQPAYILHTRAYRDTSLLLDLFSPEYGRVSAVARGVKSARARFKGLLQPFVPLLVSWVGRTELLTLTGAESHAAPHYLSANSLLCGIYVNELLVRLLHRYDPHPNLYRIYQHTLTQLGQGQTVQPALRIFEKELLSELGYALQLDRESFSDSAIAPEQFYYFDPKQGLSRCTEHLADNSPYVFSGESLLAFHSNDFLDEKYQRDAKRLLRIALGHLLGDKPINSRELFRGVIRG